MIKKNLISCSSNEIKVWAIEEILKDYDPILRKYKEENKDLLLSKSKRDAIILKDIKQSNEEIAFIGKLNGIRQKNVSDKLEYD